MKTKLSETEVNRIPVDAIDLALRKMPYDGQDEDDRRMAEHFLLKHAGKKLNSRLDKLDKAVKGVFPEDKDIFVAMSKNYRLEATKGDARENFDPDMFIDEICKRFPSVPKPALVLLKQSCKKSTARPISIEIEYIGDIARKDE